MGFRDEYIIKKCPVEILQRAKKLHDAIIQELQNRGMLPIKDLSIEEEKIIDGEEIEWSVEPQHSNKQYSENPYNGWLNVKIGYWGTYYLINEPRSKKSGGHNVEKLGKLSW